MSRRSQGVGRGLLLILRVLLALDFFFLPYVIALLFFFLNCLVRVVILDRSDLNLFPLVQLDASFFPSWYSVDAKWSGSPIDACCWLLLLDPFSSRVVVLIALGIWPH